MHHKGHGIGEYPTLKDSNQHEGEKLWSRQAYLKKTEDLRKTAKLSNVSAITCSFVLMAYGKDNPVNWMITLSKRWQLCCTSLSKLQNGKLCWYTKQIHVHYDPWALSHRLHCQTVTGQLWPLTFPLISANICMTVALCRRHRWTCGHVFSLRFGQFPTGHHNV